MNRAILLLTTLITTISYGNQNNCFELDADIEFGENLISFDGKQATLQDHMDNNSKFSEVELWYENWGMHYLGTIGSPQRTSLLNDTARFYTLKEQQPARKRVVWSEDHKALILLEGWNSGYASKACKDLTAHKAMVGQFEKKYEAIEQELQKNLP
jgi:hypothetical protein